MSEFIGKNEECNWDRSFDALVSKFIVRMREDYRCDKVQEQRIPNGKSMLLQVGLDGRHWELYQIYYSGKVIAWERVR